MNIGESYTFFFRICKMEKKDKNSGSHIFRASMYSFDFNTAIYTGTPRARSNIAQKRCFKMTKFRNNAFPGVLYRFFFSFLVFPRISPVRPNRRASAIST